MTDQQWKKEVNEIRQLWIESEKRWAEAEAESRKRWAEADKELAGARKHMAKADKELADAKKRSVDDDKRAAARYAEIDRRLTATSKLLQQGRRFCSRSVKWRSV